jgi:hypothetical protein
MATSSTSNHEPGLLANRERWSASISAGPVCTEARCHAQWPYVGPRPFQIEGVWVTWPSKLIEQISAPGPLTSEVIDQIALDLSVQLPATR